MERISIMKRISIILMIVVMFMIGCIPGIIQIDQENQEAIAKITARRVGCELAIQYPDIAKEINAICQEIATQDEPDFIKIAIIRLSVVLTTDIKDPLLAADIQDILILLKIETDIEITSDHVQTIKSAAIGLISGIKTGGEL